MKIWKQFGEKPKWRVEKPGRVAVMDGDLPNQRLQDTQHAR